MKKKLFTGVLATLACFACLSGCKLLDPVNPPKGSDSSVVNPDSSVDSTPSAKLNLEEVKAYADEYFLAIFLNTPTDKDFELTNSLSYDSKVFPLTWNVNLPSGVTLTVVDGNTKVVFDKTSTEELKYTLTVTITDPTDATNTATVSFNRTFKISPLVPAPITQSPVEGKAYKLHIYHAQLQKDYYMTGEIYKTYEYYFDITEDFEKAIDVYAEKVEGEEDKFYLYHNGVDGNQKQYINARKSGTHISNYFEATAETQWFFDAEIGTMVTVINDTDGTDKKFYLGCDTDPTHKSISPQSSSENMGKLIEMIDRTKVPDADKIAQTVKELTIASVYAGAGSLELANVGSTYPEASITWAIKSGDGAEIADSKLTVATAPTSATEFVLTATVSCGDATAATKDLTVKFIPNTVDAIIDALFALKSGESFANEVTLTGVVSAFDSKGEYNEQYGNISIDMMVAYGNTYKTIGCYHLGGVGAKEVGIGDTLTVKGILTNYNGTRQFGQDCTIENRVDGAESDVPTIPSMTPAEIVDAAYALGADEKLEGTQTLTGTITIINDAYSTQYKNVTVTIVVEGKEDKPIVCYRMKGGETLAVGDVITVTGTIINYQGNKIEFERDCTYTGAGSGEVTPPAEGDIVAPEGAVTVNTAIADLATKFNWTACVGQTINTSIKEQTIALDDVASFVINGGSFSGNYFKDGVRMYATDTPAGSITLSVKEGYTLVSVKISTVEGTYAFLQKSNDSTDYSNTAVAVYDSSITLTAVKNGSSGKQVRITDIQVVYAAGKVENPNPDQGGNEGGTTTPPTSGEEGGTTTPNVPEADSLLSIEEALTFGATFEHNTYSSSKYYVVGVINDVYNTQYGNMYIKDESGNTLTIYGTYSADGVNRYDVMETKPVAGDTVKIYGILGTYNGTVQLKNGWIVEHTPAEGGTTTPPTGGEEGGTTTPPTGSEEDGEENTAVKKYTFADYDAGTQYAKNEKHVLDETVTVTTTEAHFTSELRIYSNSSNDGYAIIQSTKVIDAITLNAGNKADTLNVYGSTDGNTWVLIKAVATTSAYADHTVTIENSEYKYLKLDVAGTQQVRIKYMELTFAD